MTGKNKELTEARKADIVLDALAGEGKWRVSVKVIWTL